MDQKDMGVIVEVCFRKPEDGEPSVAMNSTELIRHIQHQFPSVRNTHPTKIQLGLALKERGFQHTSRSNVMFYRVVPLQGRDYASSLTILWLVHRLMSLYG